MSQGDEDTPDHELAPGDEPAGVRTALRGYVAGLGLSVLLTAAAFLLVHTRLVWPPGIPVALAVLAVAQMGVHLVFFLHIGTGPDNTNNVLALAFGVLIVALVAAGSVWIMFHLNSNLMPADTAAELRMWH